MDEDTAIKAENVSKDFSYTSRKSITVKSLFTGALKKQLKDQEKTQHALKDISFEVKRGEFFGIVGRNGSGKSTLLKMLAGIYQPTSGNISVQGKLVPFIELGVGFNPELTGRENVYLNGALLNFSEKEVDKFYNEVVEFAELEKFMDKKLKNYSSGMQVRLAFSMAIRAKADILLIDEVLAVGDADFQRKCFDYFKKLKRDKKTVVFVSHDMGAIREYCDRVILVQDGVMHFEGSADKIANEYLKLFNDSHQNGSPTKNIDAANRWGSGEIKFESIKAEAKGDQLSILMCIKNKSKEINGVVIGVRIKDSEDKLIAGTNTLHIEGFRRLSFKPYEIQNININTKNIFGTGTFSVGAAIRLSDQVTIFDNWDNAAEFKNVREESYYPIIIPADIRIDG